MEYVPTKMILGYDKTKNAKSQMSIAVVIGGLPQNLRRKLFLTSITLLLTSTKILRSNSRPFLMSVRADGAYNYRINICTYKYYLLSL